MVRKSMFYALLGWLLVFSVKTKMFAQVKSEYEFDTRPIPEELKKVKPYREAQWSRGTVKVKNHKGIQTYLCYEPEKEVLLTYSNGRVNAYTALQIEGFGFFDEDSKLLRRYQSLPHDPSTGAKKYYIYEVISLGEFSLLRRETGSYATCHKPTKESEEHPHFNYFVCHENAILPYEEFQNRIQPTLATRDQAFKSSIARSVSSETTLADRRRMIIRLNQLGLSSDKPAIAMVKK